MPAACGVSDMAGSLKEVRASGLDAVNLVTSLLQRARLADPLAGVWEAADVQWLWGKPQRSDEIAQIFWLDDDGPVAGVLLTSSADDSGTSRWPGSTLSRSSERWSARRGCTT